jgi:hypothetical protein
MNSGSFTQISRRRFVQLSFLSGAGLMFYHCGPQKIRGMVFIPEKFTGNLKQEKGTAPLKNAIWYTGTETGDGILYRFPRGTLTIAGTLTADMLLDGNRMSVFVISLQEGEDGPAFENIFGLINQCQARIRLPLQLTDMNKWRMEREGAWMKQIIGGDRVNLQNVDRMSLYILRKSKDMPTRWCQTPFIFTVEPVDKITHPILPKGPLLDELGQSTLHEWPAKTRTVSELIERLQDLSNEASLNKYPQSFSRYGGWLQKHFKATGFFRTQKDGDRWWLVDPDGYAFWSAGVDCVRVDTDANIEGLETALSWQPDATGEYKAIFSNRRASMINYLAANFIRAFGADKWYERWAAISLGLLKNFRFNTVANWSDWQIAQKAGFPYVRPLNLRLQKTPYVYRDFPDVFDPAYKQEAAAYAEQLRETLNDPAFVGYFLMNEPTWGFSSELPAVGMLYNTSSCRTRQELAKFLLNKYHSEEKLSAAWGMNVTAVEIKEGAWTKTLTAAALKDLEGFSAIMTEVYFRTLSEACRTVDPNHLNLGIRYQGVPPTWVVAGMKSFDVFSMNCYQQKVPHDDMKKIHDMLHMPVMIGEWHFGALDVGLPATGIGAVKDQTARGQAYRVYFEDAAANPYIVGVHWFTLYDESALGRYDGENYNIGFLDVCNRPYEALANAARISHENMYLIASGQVEPYSEAPEYLPLLFV